MSLLEAASTIVLVLVIPGSAFTKELCGGKYFCGSGAKCVDGSCTCTNSTMDSPLMLVRITRRGNLKLSYCLNACGEYWCGFGSTCNNNFCECTKSGEDSPWVIIHSPTHENRKFSHCRKRCEVGSNCFIGASCEFSKTTPNAMYDCACPDGHWMPSKDGQCIDVDECAQDDRCGDNSVCKNTQGNFMCECQEGYLRTDDNPTVCRDKDECSENKTICGENSVCINLPGNYSCSFAEVPVYNPGSDRDDFESSNGLTVGLAVGFGGLLIIIIVMAVIFLARRRKNTVEKIPERRVRAENQQNPTDHLYCNDEGTVLARRAEVTPVVNVHTVVHVGQPANPTGGIPRKTGRAGTSEKEDISTGTGPGNPGPIVNVKTEVIVARSQEPTLPRPDGVDEARPVQKPQRNNSDTPIYTVPKKGTKFGLVPEALNDPSHDHKIQESMTKQKHETVGNADEDDLANGITSNNYNTLYEVNRKYTNKRAENVKPGSASLESGYCPNEVPCDLSWMPDQTSTDAEISCWNVGDGDRDYDQLKIAKV